MYKIWICKSVDDFNNNEPYANITPVDVESLEDIKDFAVLVEKYGLAICVFKPEEG